MFRKEFYNQSKSRVSILMSAPSHHSPLKCLVLKTTNGRCLYNLRGSLLPIYFDQYYFVIALVIFVDNEVIMYCFSLQDPMDGSYLLLGQCEWLFSSCVWFQYFKVMG